MRSVFLIFALIISFNVSSKEYRCLSIKHHTCQTWTKTKGLSANTTATVICVDHDILQKNPRASISKDEGVAIHYDYDGTTLKGASFDEKLCEFKSESNLTCNYTDPYKLNSRKQLKVIPDKYNNTKSLLLEYIKSSIRDPYDGFDKYSFKHEYLYYACF